MAPAAAALLAALVRWLGLLPLPRESQRHRREGKRHKETHYPESRAVKIKLRDASGLIW